MHRGLAIAASLLGLGGLAAGASARTGALPQQSGVVDLLRGGDVLIDGAVAQDHAAGALSGAGDVNGDGRADFVIGASAASNNGRRNSGSAWVVFGSESARQVDLARLESSGGGFRIDGAAAFDAAGTAVAGAGDVNGDGRADVIVGAPFARSSLGSAYVVFGKASTSPVDLAGLGEAGFRIDAGTGGDGTGRAVAGSGDVNGDGRADLVIGAARAGAPKRFASGYAYVVFGKASSSTVELATLGDGGFRIDGSARLEFAGTAVAGGGDVNGDGRADVLVGSDADHNGRFSSGSTYVVFGRRSTTTIDLAELGDGGFRIDGAKSGDGAGHAVAAAGDVNGDGRGDVLVGAEGADNNGRAGSGSAYLVFGTDSPATIDLGTLGAGGFRIDGANVFDAAGVAVSHANDVNGDGRPDLLLGAPSASNNGRIGSGSAYVVFGKTSTAAVDLASLGQSGFRMDGAQVQYQTGRAVAGVGDVNGDGRADVLVGAPSASYRGGEGAAYVVYGFGVPELAYEPLAASVGVPLAPHGPKLVKRTGTPFFSVTPPLPPGLDINPGTGAIVGTPAVGRRSTTYTVTMEDLAGSVSAPLTVAIRDTTPPRVAVSGRSPQRVLRQGGVILRVACSEPGTVRTSGRVLVPGRGAVALASSRATFGAAGRRTLKVGLPAASQKRLASLLAGSFRGRAIVDVRAVDRFGNVTTIRRRIAVTGS